MTPTAMNATQAAEFRAAGTDLSERRRSGVSTGPLIDISATSDTIGMHWGTEGSYCPNPEQKSIAKILADAGADVIVGTHAHMPQGDGFIEAADG